MAKPSVLAMDVRLAAPHLSAVFATRGIDNGKAWEDAFARSKTRLAVRLLIENEKNVKEGRFG